MERLDFELPDFTRHSWNDQRAADVWLPRIQRIRAVWNELEWRSVEHGIRLCTLLSLTPSELVSNTRKFVQAGLSILPLEMRRVDNLNYLNKLTDHSDGDIILFRVVVGSITTVREFGEAWDRSDESIIAKLLGYPNCCYEFYRKIWVEDSSSDTSWYMALNSHHTELSPRKLSTSGHLECNILWRWLGIRSVPHLPCSFDCNFTRELAQRMIQLGNSIGFENEMNWLTEILSWPVEWSALHGIAEIKTPILKITTKTDATPVPYVVQKQGSTYPVEGAVGLTFPYKQEQLKFSTSRSSKLAAQQAVTIFPEWYAYDNGFSSAFVMEQAHQPIIEHCSNLLKKYTSGASVIDLGCGNGILLNKIYEREPNVQVYGIEKNSSAIEHCFEMFPQFQTHVICGDIFDTTWPEKTRYTLALLTPGRFLEVSSDRGEFLKRQLEQKCDFILFYAYKDWTESRSLHQLAKETGFELQSNLVTNEFCATCFVNIRSER